MNEPRSRSWRLPTLVAVALSGALVLAAVLSAPEVRLHIRKVPLPESIQRCTTDAECVMVNQIGCCSCKSSGARGAIRATASDELRLFLKRTCRHRGVCMRLRTCWYDLVPACVNGRCIARRARG